LDLGPPPGSASPWVWVLQRTTHLDSQFILPTPGGFAPFLLLGTSSLDCFFFLPPHTFTEHGSAVVPSHCPYTAWLPAHWFRWWKEEEEEEEEWLNARQQRLMATYGRPSTVYAASHASGQHRRHGASRWHLTQRHHRREQWRRCLARVTTARHQPITRENAVVAAWHRRQPTRATAEGDASRRQAQLRGIAAQQRITNVSARRSGAGVPRQCITRRADMA